MFYKDKENNQTKNLKGNELRTLLVFILLKTLLVFLYNVASFFIFLYYFFIFLYYPKYQK